MRKALLISVAVLAITACSTTRVLQEGQYRLASNKVHITDPKGVKTTDITPFIRQSANSYFLFGWNPLLNIYNWSDGSGKGLNKVWEKIGVAPVVYSSETLPSSRENIANHLSYLGYYDSEVTTKVDTVRRLIKVNYYVHPGKRYPIEEIRYSLPIDNRTFQEEFNSDKRNIGIKEGGFLSERDLETESARSAKYFNNLGYYDFSKNHYFFEADTLGGKAVLKYEIRDYSRNETQADAHPIEKYTFGNVNISRSANIKFRDDVLRRLNTIKPGTVYNEKDVNTTYNRMSSLKLFNGVGIDLSPTDSNTVNSSIRLSESSVTGIKANLELSTNSAGLMGINPKFSWYHKNIFGGAEWLSVDFSSNFQFKPKSDVRATEVSLSTSITFPRFIGLPENLYHDNEIPRTEVKASFSYQDRPEYNRTIVSMSYGYSGSRDKRFFYQLFPFRTNVVKVFNLSEEFYKFISENYALIDAFYDHVDMGVGGMLHYTTNSDIVPKTAYSYARLNFDLSGNILKLLKVQNLFGLNYSRYVRGELSLGHTFRFGPDENQALATRFVLGAGYALGNDVSSMPYEKKFFVGGASSMRGWQSRTLGPGFFTPEDYGIVFKIPSQAGDMKLELDMEYRFPMFWKLEGALFAEAGNIWNLNQNVGATDIFKFNDFYKAIAADWGVGLRVNLDFILMRLDMGLKVHDPTEPEGMRWRGPDRWFKDNGFTIHFGVGYPF